MSNGQFVRNDPNDELGIIAGLQPLGKRPQFGSHVIGLRTNQPAVETKNRRPMRPNPVAPWELRIDKLRVYYDVEDQPEPVVYVLAVGIKRRNLVRLSGRLRVQAGGEVYVLRRGDAILLDSSAPHRFTNIGKEVVRTLWVNVHGNRWSKE